MTESIARIEVFSLIIKDQPGEALRILGELAAGGIDLTSLSTTPIGPHSTQISFSCRDSGRLRTLAEQVGLHLLGPQCAFLVGGQDELGVLVRYHESLADAGVNIHGSYGVADGRGGYGYVFIVRDLDGDRAAHALGLPG